MNVEGGYPNRLLLIVSPRSGIGEIVTVNITDIYGNLAPAANGTVELNGIGSVDLTNGHGRGYFIIKGKGIKRITGMCSELNLSAVSNPFFPGQNIAWGEIHSHSGISDGLGTDEENYKSAILSGLDFGALSDHDTLMMADDMLWGATIENAEKYLDEPDFITLLGYESLAYHDDEIAGHINIYYPGNDF